MNAESHAEPRASSSAADEAREIVGLFRSLRRHLVRGSRAELARSGLTAAQVSVISLLGTNGAMTLGELSRELELSHSTVSGIVDRLQAKDLVVRKPSPDDRRYVRIFLGQPSPRVRRRRPDRPPGSCAEERIGRGSAQGQRWFGFTGTLRRSSALTAGRTGRCTWILPPE